MRLRSEGLTAREVDGTLMVLDLASSQYFGIRGSGRLLYDELATGERSVDDLVESVTGVYDVDDVTARADVEDFVSRLRGAGLLE